MRHCPYCGLTTGKVDVFCEDCISRIEDQFHGKRGVFKVSGFPFSVHSSISWGNHNHLVVDSFLKALKRSDPSGKFVEIAKALKSRGYRIHPKTLIVPCPSKADAFGSREHALLWARALAEVFKVPMLIALKFENETLRQKGQSRENRSQLQMKSLVQNHAAHRILFVDDVITTGSTALAAYRALGKPKSFHVLTLACRLKS